ncbi:hypothetical protein [Chamaesiphon minutus]|nr:hypothetical protein [Chamaesiphon minutus]
MAVAKSRYYTVYSEITVGRDRLKADTLFGDDRATTGINATTNKWI